MYPPCRNARARVSYFGFRGSVCLVSINEMGLGSGFAGSGVAGAAAVVTWIQYTKLLGFLLKQADCTL